MQLHTQLKQLWNWSLKKIQAWTRIQTHDRSTSAVLYQLSYQANWELSHCEFVIYPQKIKNANEYMNNIYLNCGERFEEMIDHRSDTLITLLSEYLNFELQKSKKINSTCCWIMILASSDVWFQFEVIWS